jgi:hypothetical protein
MTNKKVPVGLEVGDEFETPWGTLEILDKRGEYNGSTDNRQWYVCDSKTDEKLWVDWDFFSEIMQANVYNTQQS